MDIVTHHTQQTDHRPDIVSDLRHISCH